MGHEFKACVECTEKCLLVHGNKSDASPVITSFVTVMSGNEFSKFMELPPNVARAVSLADQSTVIEDSQGLRWNVAISSMDGSFAFHHGWNAFSLDHDLQLGNILVFTYIRGSHFAVKIYDNSGCELSSFETDQKKRKRDDRDSIFKGGWCYATDKSSMSKDGSGTCGCSDAEISKRLDEVNGKGKAPITTQFASNCDDRKEAGSVNSPVAKDVGSTVIPSDGSELERTLKNSDHEVKVKKEEPSEIHSCTETSGELLSTLAVIPEENEETISAVSTRATKKCRTGDGSGGEEAISRDQRLKPDHPTFVVMMQEPSYLTTALKLDINFAQKYDLSRRNVNLQIPNGSTWPVICSVTSEDGIRYTSEGVARHRYPSWCIREEVARIRYRGWIKFATDNGLQVGDTCVFEMVKQQPEITFLVHIIRATYATKLHFNNISQNMKLRRIP
ncbi:B3 domain-containing protein Os11g0197600-like isoform X2 [Rosa rugosa]|nr:B3 domain-containing protein Os11g0197600-like isoform X2 [Rosa rugosa]XP_062026091.1 B3 domain-containing protein Os11g0197600-like isoform X2 [Rosa rugosa]